jgi:hypothetical protein
MPTKLPISLLLLASTTACYNWRTDPPSPGATVTTLTSRVVRLTLLDGRRLEVADPNIVHDTLRAWNLRDLDTGRRVQVTVPVSQIRQVETRRMSAGKTTALTLGIGVPVGLAVAALVALSNMCIFDC